MHHPLGIVAQDYDIAHEKRSPKTTS